MDFRTAVATCLSKYATFRGRASRSEFWWFYLFTVIVMTAASMISRAMGDPNDILGTLTTFALLLPSTAAGCRRLHDVGRSGWWQLLAITVIGIVLLVYWMVQPSRATGAKYGPAPEN